MIKKHLARGLRSDHVVYQFFRHYFVGGISFISNYLLFNALFLLGFGVVSANAITYAVLFGLIFTLQKHFTYRSRENWLIQLALFAASTLGYYLIETTLLVLLIKSLGLAAYISKLVTMVGLAPLSFLSQRFIVFRRREIAA